MAIKDIEEAIAFIYKEACKNSKDIVPENTLKEAFLVVKLTDTEAKKLQMSTGNFIGFISFIRAYDDIDYAIEKIKRKKDDNYYLFRICLKKPELLDYDFGYWHNRSKDMEG